MSSPPPATDALRTAVNTADLESSKREIAREVPVENNAREKGEQNAKDEIRREILGYTPRDGGEGSTFSATVRYDGKANPRITQLRLGFGSFIVTDTKCTSSQSSDDPSASRMMLTCRVPAFDWVGWFMRKVPVYVLVIDEDGRQQHDTLASVEVETGRKRKQEGEFVVIDSWFLGEFKYDDENSRFARPKLPTTNSAQYAPQPPTQQQLFTPLKQPNPQPQSFQIGQCGEASRESPSFAFSRQPPEKLPDTADDVTFPEETSSQNPVMDFSPSATRWTFTSTPISDPLARPRSQSSQITPRDFAHPTHHPCGQHDVPPPRSIAFSPPVTPSADHTSSINQAEPNSCSSSSSSSCSCSLSSSSATSCCSLSRAEDHRQREPSLTNAVGCAGLITPRMSPVNPYYIPNSMGCNATAQHDIKRERKRGHTTNPENCSGNEALLKWDGNGSLDDMVRNWSYDEKVIRRRLVQFTRRHERNVIHCGFGHFNPDSARPENSFVVSCIYWPEPLTATRPGYYRRSAAAELGSTFFDPTISPVQSPTFLSPSPVYGYRQNGGHQPHDGPTHYITSVDLMRLLEFLLDCHFSVDEKNRIRRNLEVFRPLTVSKRKAETKELYDAIMAFPNPKPRNIDKGLKIYEWFDVKCALQKITSKYTAIYSVSDMNHQTRTGSQHRGDDEDAIAHVNQFQELQYPTQSPSLYVADRMVSFFTPNSASNSPIPEYRSESLPDVRHFHFHKHLEEAEESASSSSTSSSRALTTTSSFSTAAMTAAFLPRISSDPVFDGIGSEQIVRPKPQRPRITALPTPSFSPHPNF